MLKSFRLRITFWYMAFFSLLFVSFSIFLYEVLARTLVNRLDESLAVEANTTASLFQDELEEMHGDVAKAASEAVSSMRLRGSQVAVMRGTEPVASSAPLPRREFEAIAALAGSAASDAAIAIAGFGPHGARASIHRMRAEGASFLILAVEPLDSVVEDLRGIRRMIFFALPALLAIAGFGGYALARRSLAPLGWMAEQAHRISGHNLEARLEIGDAAEEIAMLSASFNELLARLDQSFDTMRRFVADASHELRTPISVIRGEADVALSHPRDAREYREALTVILDESRRLSRLVDDLLNLARADAGHVVLQKAEFYLNDVLAECCRSVQTLAKARQVGLECRAPEDAAFRGDEELVRRLVVNLLDNAIRYTPAGGKVTAVLETAGAEYRILISDTGPGISPEAAPHVFERFYRIDPARSRENGGFGLGLAIVKWIAEVHNGGVALATQPGMGSTFTVTLPA